MGARFKALLMGILVAVSDLSCIFSYPDLWISGVTFESVAFFFQLGPSIKYLHPKMGILSPPPQWVRSLCTIGVSVRDYTWLQEFDYDHKTKKSSFHLDKWFLGCTIGPNLKLASLYCSKVEKWVFLRKFYIFKTIESSLMQGGALFEHQKSFIYIKTWFFV